MATTSITSPRHRTAPHPQRPEGRRRADGNDLERWATLLAGGGLAAYGLSRGGLRGLALAALGGVLLYRGVRGRDGLFAYLGMNAARPRGARSSIPAGQGVKLEQRVTIDRPAEEVYRLWRDLANLPRFMRHLESVRTTGGNRSHWVARGPLGQRVEWEAEIITERPHELIGWRSLEGSDVDTAGSVHFGPAPGGRGTEVTVILKYDPPAGKAGAAVARLFGSAPEQEIEEDLRRFKQLMETGTVATTGGQPAR